VPGASPASSTAPKLSTLGQRAANPQCRRQFTGWLGRGQGYNALAESFFATLKTKCFEQTPATRAQARLKLFDYIETFYNPRRLHSALGYKSPVEFKNQFN